MAYVLSLRPHSPLKRSFSDNPYLRSCSPLKDQSRGALHDVTPGNTSACSLYSLGSNLSNLAVERLRGTENTPPPGSRSLLDLVPENEKRDAFSKSADNGARKRDCGIHRPPPSLSSVAVPSAYHLEKTQETGPVSESKEEATRSKKTAELEKCGQEEGDELFDLLDAIQSPAHARQLKHTPGNSHDTQKAHVSAPVDPQPFRRWMSTLRRRHMYRRTENTSEALDVLATTDEAAAELPRLPRVSGSTHRQSNSLSSSLEYVTAMKTASMTIASASVGFCSEQGGLHCKVRLGNRSSNYSDARKSIDGQAGTLGPVIDESAWLRSVQRRKVVEELISSEESYIADLKVLINDYILVLPSVPAIPAQTRSSIQQNITQILQLHEDLLSELHRVVPHADVTNSAHEAFPIKRAKHIRFHSADLVPGRGADHIVSRRLRHSFELGRSPDRRSPGLAVDTKTVGQIAKIFNKHMKRFFTYEEYGAQWTTMSSELTATCKGLQGWHDYERGVEALSRVIASENSRQSSSKKALTFADLLIKPIQRVCKYPLLFDDLCRQTPVYDDPETHAELEKALFRLQETIREVNKAKDDPRTRRLIEITWQLQDRLTFQERTLSRALVFRLLGHVLVCGVLHVAYQTPDRVKGQYMVCVLYKSCLVLATTSRFYTPYSIVASIALANGSIESSGNGRGIQCHTAPHTWKLVFEHGHRLHEIILSACSAQEEEVWKQQLRERIMCETHDFVEGQSTMQDMFSSLSLDIKSIGPVFGHADNLVRRMSVHRAATLGSKTNTTQVIIKNTLAQKTPDPPPTFAPNLVARSQSHMSSNHVPTLAPRRGERIRLETTLEDVWTKDVLPFPGMSSRRVENQIRASANSVMRKLSMASIASNFSRRSPSFSSMSNTRSDDSFGSKATKVSQGNVRSRATAERHPAPAVVDFHNAPAAFLPTDFELQDTRPSSRRRHFANRAGGAERSNEKTTPGKPKRARRLSAHMISLPRTDSSSRVESRLAPSGSASTVLRPTDANVDFSKRQDNERQTKDKKGGTSPRAAPSSTPPAKKFLKNKSRIFKFWG